MNEFLKSSNDHLASEKFQQDWASTCRLAAFWLKIDWARMAAASCLISLPVCLLVLAPGLSSGSAIGLTLLKRVLEMSCLYLLGKRWLEPFLADETPKQQRTGFITLLILGFLAALLKNYPLVAASLPVNGAGLFLSALVGIAAIVLLLRFYFYFAPPLFGVRGLRRCLLTAQHYTAQHKTLPLRILVPPAALWLFVSQLASLPAPDGRLAGVIVLNVFFEAFAWILAACLGISAALNFSREALPEGTLLRTDVLEELKSAGPVAAPRISWIFRPRSAVHLAALALLLLIANQFRLFNTKPDVVIERASVTIEGRSLWVELELSDEKHSFRGFYPKNFALAGPEQSQDSLLATGPSQIKINGEESTGFVLQQMPADSTSATVLLRFDTNRRSSSLKEIENLYLWYFKVRMLKLDMSKAGEA